MLTTTKDISECYLFTNTKHGHLINYV